MAGAECGIAAARAAYFDLHAPRAGGYMAEPTFPAFSLPFQSTRPTRGATLWPAMFTEQNLFQSTRPTRGATLPPRLIFHVRVF